MLLTYCTENARAASWSSVWRRTNWVVPGAMPAGFVEQESLGQAVALERLFAGIFDKDLVHDEAEGLQEAGAPGAGDQEKACRWFAHQSTCVDLCVITRLPTKVSKPLLLGRASHGFWTSSHTIHATLSKYSGAIWEGTYQPCRMVASTALPLQSR